jgi:hypothetical protein
MAGGVEMKFDIEGRLPGLIENDKQNKLCEEFQLDCLSCLDKYFDMEVTNEQQTER